MIPQFKYFDSAKVSVIKRWSSSSDPSAPGGWYITDVIIHVIAHEEGVLVLNKSIDAHGRHSSLNDPNVHINSVFL